VVADARAPDAIWFERDDVDPERKRWEWRAVGQAVRLDEAAESRPEVAALPPRHGFLRQPVTALPSPANLDQDERGGWTRVNGQEVDLGPAEVEVSAQDAPSGLLELPGHEELPVVAQLLGRRSGPRHPPILRIGA
jgi:hypothetical protein